MLFQVDSMLLFHDTISDLWVGVLLMVTGEGTMAYEGEKYGLLLL
jgi:hypothetical protein